MRYFMRVKINETAIMVCRFAGARYHGSKCCIYRSPSIVVVGINGDEYYICFDTKEEAKEAMDQLLVNGYYDASGKEVEVL